MLHTNFYFNLRINKMNSRKLHYSTYLSDDESLEEADDKLSPPFDLLLGAV